VILCLPWPDSSTVLPPAAMFSYSMISPKTHEALRRGIRRGWAADAMEERTALKDSLHSLQLSLRKFFLAEHGISGEDFTVNG
jgi:hypothetical protein